MNALATIFEVMDKEPSLLAVWLLFLFLAVGGFLLCHYRYWLLLVTLPISLFFAWLYLSELRDPFVGPAIIREAGKGYVYQSYIAMALAIVLPSCAIIFRKKKLP